MPRKAHYARAGGKNKISNVRIVDQYAGSDGAKVDRILSQLQTTQSQIRVLCTSTDTFQLNTSGPGTFVASGVYIRGSDDFTSMAAQFQEYRIAAVRYDIYDINPALVGQVVFSTWHDVIPGAVTTPTFSFNQVIDGPDSQVIPPGTGKISFTWMAKGSMENEFQTDDTSGWQDFGGLRGASLTSTAAGVKYQVITKAIVDFRGRI